MSAELHVLTALYYLSRMNVKYSDVAEKFGLSDSSIHAAVNRMLEYLINDLGPVVIRLPTVEMKAKTACHYKYSYGFPHIIGSFELYSST